jgi:hypothetical protein
MLDKSPACGWADAYRAGKWPQIWLIGAAADTVAPHQ